MAPNHGRTLVASNDQDLWMVLGGGGVKERTFPRKIFEVTGF